MRRTIATGLVAAGLLAVPAAAWADSVRITGDIQYGTTDSVRITDDSVRITDDSVRNTSTDWT